MPLGGFGKTLDAMLEFHTHNDQEVFSLAGSSGRPIDRYLGPPHNSGQLPVVLLVGRLPLAAVEAGAREVLRIR